MNRLYIYNDSAIYSGVLSQNKSHSHHAMQLTIALDGVLEIEVGDRTLECSAILLNQNVGHRVVSRDTALAVVLFEPVQDSRYRIDFSIGDFLVMDDPASLIGKLESGDFKGCIELLLGMGVKRALDDRIIRMVRHIEREENCRHDLDFFTSDLSLSKSRISHLFKTELGVSLKHFLLWKRSLFAIDSLRSSSNLTEIALDCGFSDLSHFSRTFKKMFGHSLTEIFNHSSSVQVEFNE